MPLKQITRRDRISSFGKPLPECLIEEWRHPGTTATQPLILEGQKTPEPNERVYVVWDDRELMANLERSEIIVEAFHRGYGEPKSLNRIIEMGLISGRARRMGIE